MIFFLLCIACSTGNKVRDSSAADGTAGSEDPFVDVVLDLAEPESVTTESVPFRDRRRMNLFQLDRALEDVTGHDYPKCWEATGSLGQPDYQEIIKEVREPELFFQKFLQDAAHRNCEHVLNDDEDSAPEDRIFLRYIEVGDTTASSVRENLVYLLLRFHGHRYSTEHPHVEPWFSLFDAIQQSTEDSQTTWKAICVALIRHPDFYSY